MFHVVHLQFEDSPEALGIGCPTPRLTWRVETDEPAWWQAAWQARCSIGGRTVTSERLEGDASVGMAWPFAPLGSRTRAEVCLRVWAAGSPDPSPWSAPWAVETGLLAASDWSARFIAAPWDTTPLIPGPVPAFRREFSLRRPVVQARLSATALGVYELTLNGETVGDQVLAPGWTSYADRLKVQTYDVTPLLRTGPNTCGALVADGWFRGRLGYNGGRRAIYGGRTALLAQLDVEYDDGTSERIVTDRQWSCSRSTLLRSELYDGEACDARVEARWGGVDEVDYATTLVPWAGPPVRRTAFLPGRQVLTSPSGRTLVDFGQNVVGRVRFSVTGPAGTEIRFRHAEVLEEGELGVRPLRTAQQTDTFVLSGRGRETFEPRFTFHGFRYVEVSGWPGRLEASDLTAVVCHSDLERTGWFWCSHPLINRLHENIVWSVRGNFVDIPTDCPQRDERLGWTGDIQIFAPTGAYLFDTRAFLASWLDDLAREQRDGAVPNFVPNISLAPVVSSGAWGDAAVLVPWALYTQYGDPTVLKAQYASVTGWMGQVERVLDDKLLWSKGFQFGDWLDPASPPGRPGDARTDSALVATAYVVRTARVASQIADLLGHPADAARFADLSTRVRQAFQREFVAPGGRAVCDTVTAHALVIAFDLSRDDEGRTRAGTRLAELVRDAGYRISTGFVGTPLVCDALCATGHLRAAFLLLLQKQNPSWLYPVTMGATTMWERWDSMLPDGRINPGDTTSFNHYALGAVADWLHRSVGGLAPAAPGYKRLLVRPLVGGGLTSAGSRLLTPYGPASCQWDLTGGELTVNVTVPPNTRAEVWLPRSGREPLTVESGTHRWTYPAMPEERSPVTLETTLSELFAQPELWERLKDLAPYLKCFETITQISSTTTVAGQLDFLPDGEAQKPVIQAAFDRLNRGA